MDSKTAHDICLNLRDPCNSGNRVHLTAKAVRLVSILFSGKNVDIVTLHSTLLRIAYIRKCMKSKKYLTMSDIITYILSIGLVTIDDVKDAVSRFDIEKDSPYHEIDDAKRIITSL